MNKYNTHNSVQLLLTYKVTQADADAYLFIVIIQNWLSLCVPNVCIFIEVMQRLFVSLCTEVKQYCVS